VIPSFPKLILAPFVALFKAPLRPTTPLLTLLGIFAFKTSSREILAIPVVDATIPPKEPALVN